MIAVAFEADIVSEFLRIPNFEQFKNKHVRVVIEEELAPTVAQKEEMAPVHINTPFGPCLNHNGILPGRSFIPLLTSLKKNHTPQKSHAPQNQNAMQQSQNPFHLYTVLNI